MAWGERLEAIAKWIGKLWCKHYSVTTTISLEEIIEAGLGGLSPFEWHYCQECGRQIYNLPEHAYHQTQFSTYSRTLDHPLPLKINREVVTQLESEWGGGFDESEYQMLVEWVQRTYPQLEVEK